MTWKPSTKSLQAFLGDSRLTRLSKCEVGEENDWGWVAVALECNDSYFNKPNYEDTYEDNEDSKSWRMVIYVDNIPRAVASEVKGVYHYAAKWVDNLVLKEKLQ